MSLGLRTELGLYVVQGLPFLICIATPLGLYTCTFLADGRGESSVKLDIAALLKALRERNVNRPVYCQMVRALFLCVSM